MFRKIAVGLVVLLAVAWAAVRFWPEDTSEYVLTPEAEAFLATIPEATMPPDWTWHTFESFDGTPIRWGETGNGSSARATLVYVPGYTNTIEGYGEQFDLWARRGFHVVGMDMRGQGGSGGEAGGDKLPRFRDGDVVFNARDIIGLVRSLPRVGGQPLVLSGSSYGGFMTTLALLEDPDIADAYVAIAPAYSPRIEADPEDFRRATRVATRLGVGGKYGPPRPLRRSGVLWTTRACTRPWVCTCATRSSGSAG